MIQIVLLVLSDRKRQILLDHSLSYALTAIVGVLAVYLQQFWIKVRKVPDTEDTVIFKLDSQEIIYIVDMFRDTLRLLVETLHNPFIAPVNIEIIQSFMNKVGYQGVVDKKKDVIQYPHFTKLIFVDLMKKYPSIYLRLEDDYHSIKDDILLVNVYTTGNVSTPKAHMTPTLTTASPQEKKRKQSARETSLPRKSLKVTIKQKKQRTTPVPPPSDDRERDEIAKATLLNLALHKTAIATKAQENVVKVQKKLAEVVIEKMVEGEEDDESYASEFAVTMLNDDVDAFGTRIEPESHKENLKVVDDDDVNDKQKQDESKDDNVDKMDDAAEEKDNDDHTDQTLVRTHTMGSMKTRNKQREVVDHCNNVVPEITVPELISKEFATHEPKMIEELFCKHMQNTTHNLYPTTSSSTAKKSTTDLQHQLYLNMKSKPQEHYTNVDPPEGEETRRKDILVTDNK
nr:hypothetical protein [Tanacetum cinerariifolium]